MSLQEITVNGKKIFLLGTAHVSNRSVEDVSKAIEECRPDVVAVELCQQRYDALVNKKRWENLEITDVIESGRVHLFLAQILLSNFQRKIGEDLDVKPGSEMLAAVKEAEKHGLSVALVDRDIQVTLKRAADQLTALEKAKLAYGFFENFLSGEQLDEETVEKLKEKDMLTEVLEELGRETPSIKRTLVDERDVYIAEKLNSLKGERVLAVIGAGHIEGIKKHLASMEGSTKVNYSLSVGVAGCEPDAITINRETQGKKNSKMKIISYLVPALFAVMIGYSIMTHGGALTLRLLMLWFFINGTLSAIGASLVFPHPLTVAAAFLAAPFTSLNPAVAAGWIAGYVEVKLRKPRVRDFEGLMKLDGMKDYIGNRVTKTILVVALANIGSTIGTLVALPYIYSML